MKFTLIIIIIIKIVTVGVLLKYIDWKGGKLLFIALVLAETPIKEKGVS